MKNLLFVFILILISSLLYSTVRDVPGTYGTIQAGIAASVNGDVVLVQPGTYVENINYNGKLITVGSLFYTTADTSHISTTIIDGNNADPVVSILSGEDSTAVLTGFTITNGSANYGGGIYCWDSSPSLMNLKITNSWANNGGGISCRSSSNPILENVIISGNAAYSKGGGMHCSISCSPSLSNVKITNNDCTDGNGGGIFCNNYSSPSLNDVEISGNHSQFNGGGFYCNDHSSPILDDVTISDNETQNSDGGGLYCSISCNPILDNVTISGNSSNIGGGIYCLDSSPSLANVTIEENTSIGSGGGLFCDYYSSPDLYKVDILHNSSGYYGGGFLCSDNSNISLDHVTIARNLASYEGGGASIWNSSPSFVNVTITGNIGGQVGGVWGTSTFLTVSNSIIWGNIADDMITASSTISVTYSDIGGEITGIGNFDYDPFFTDPGNDYYNLHYTSLCIDSGNPSAPLDPDGTRADMGAHFFDQSINGNPSISSIIDVSNDQGRQVRINWDRSPFDMPGSSVPIEDYSIWRYDEISRISEEMNIYDNPYDVLRKVETKSNEKYYWVRDNEILTFITQIPAMGYDQYSIISPTLNDSSIVSIHYSTFEVVSHTDVTSMYFISEPDSGYSVDNIAPDETEAYITRNGSNMNISWNEVEYGTYQGNSYPEINGIWYKIYAGDSPDFVCNEAHLIETVTNLNYDYPLSGEEKKFFKIVVSDQP